VQELGLALGERDLQRLFLGPKGEFGLMDSAVRSGANGLTPKALPEPVSIV